MGWASRGLRVAGLLGLLKASTGSLRVMADPFCPIPSEHTHHGGSQGGGGHMSAKQRESEVGVGWETRAEGNESGLEKRERGEKQKPNK